jgi:hypothetical protein
LLLHMVIVVDVTEYMLTIYFIELGHNWGSYHDLTTEECSPSYRNGGSYIMHTYSLSGYDENNKVNWSIVINLIFSVFHRAHNEWLLPYLAPNRHYVSKKKRHYFVVMDVSRMAVLKLKMNNAMQAVYGHHRIRLKRINAAHQSVDCDPVPNVVRRIRHVVRASVDLCQEHMCVWQQIHFIAS